MSNIHTILSLGALVILISIMMNFYNIFSHSWYTMDNVQLGIDATGISTNYKQIAHGLAFDGALLDSTVTVTSPADLRPAYQFGAADTIKALSQFVKFDDFHLYRDTTMVPGGRIFVSEFEVHYVETTNIQQVSSIQTFTKRLDMKIWLIDTPPGPDGIDTVRASTVMGYYQFN